MFRMDSLAMPRRVRYLGSAACWFENIQKLTKSEMAGYGFFRNIPMLNLAR